MTPFPELPVGVPESVPPPPSPSGAAVGVLQCGVGVNQGGVGVAKVEREGAGEVEEVREGAREEDMRTERVSEAEGVDDSVLDGEDVRVESPGGGEGEEVALGVPNRGDRVIKEDTLPPVPREALD